MTVSKLFKTISDSEFIDNYYLKMPFASAGGADAFTGLGDWLTLKRLLITADVDLLVANSRVGVYQGQKPRTEEEARDLLAAGYTLGFRHVQNCDLEIAKLAVDFMKSFAATTDVHLYCTPANEQGFGWHYDAEEVFILQTQGSKEWLLRKNTVNPWPLIETLPTDMAYEREIMPLQRCLLHAGDWLYIPAGYWHATKAPQESISLSVGIENPSGIDFLDFLRTELIYDLRWRQRLPVLGAVLSDPSAEQLTQIRVIFAELATDLIKHISNDQTMMRYFQSVKARLGDLMKDDAQQAPREV